MVPKKPVARESHIDKPEKPSWSPKKKRQKRRREETESSTSQEPALRPTESTDTTKPPGKRFDPTKTIHVNQPSQVQEPTKSGEETAVENDASGPENSAPSLPQPSSSSPKAPSNVGDSPQALDRSESGSIDNSISPFVGIAVDGEPIVVHILDNTAGNNYESSTSVVFLALHISFQNFKIRIIEAANSECFRSIETLTQNR